MQSQVSLYIRTDEDLTEARTGQHNVKIEQRDLAGLEDGSYVAINQTFFQKLEEARNGVPCGTCGGSAAVKTFIFASDIDFRLLSYISIVLGLHFYCFRPPNLWYIVMAPPGH